MPFKSPTVPLCRTCGKPLKKWTTTVRFGDRFRMSGDDKFKDVFPKTKDEAQRYINDGKIVLTKYMLKDSRPEGEQSLSNRRDFLVKDYIREVSIWDGESYRDGFFCNNEHAMEYAYTMVRSPEQKLHTVKYLEALKAQVAK